MWCPQEGACRGNKGHKLSIRQFMSWAGISCLLPRRNSLRLCGRDRRGPLVTAQVSIHFCLPSIPGYIKKKSRSTARNPQPRFQSKLLISHLYIIALENSKYTCLERDTRIKIHCFEFPNVSSPKSRLLKRWSFLVYLFN